VSNPSNIASVTYSAKEIHKSSSITNLATATTTTTTTFMFTSGSTLYSTVVKREVSSFKY